MNYKIQTGPVEYPDILLYRHRDEDGNELVRILAIGEAQDNDDHFEIEEISFENSESAKSFIRDFSIDSAISWLERSDLLTL